MKIGQRQVPLGTVIFVAVLVILALVVLFSVIGLINEYRGNGGSGEEITVKLYDFDDADSIAQKLVDKGVIRTKWLFTLYTGTKSNSMARGFRSGDVKVKKGSSYGDLLTALLNPIPDTNRLREEVTIRFKEGCEVSEIVDLFVENGIGDRATFMRLINSEDFGYSYIPAAGTENRLEGFLFPDTYNFYADAKGDKELKDCIQRMVDNFDKKVMRDEAVKTLLDNSGMEIYDVIKLASIVEAEVGAKDEYGTISSVFHNRIKRGMKLQSCATFNYTLPRGERLPALTERQIATKTPYNTYMYGGLTPTPICNPSLSAIKAAASPDKTDYLFFCSKGALGGSAFAKTEAEHQKNIETYKIYW